MSPRHEWVALGSCGPCCGSEVIAAVSAALKCRRLVQVRQNKSGGLGFYAHVPLPKAVIALLAAVPVALPSGTDPRGVQPAGSAAA